MIQFKVGDPIMKQEKKIQLIKDFYTFVNKHQ